ncbi:hypothetical protein LJC36_03855 [Desulfovibrio sp. OttesenSCG-928-C14]|nr:hypothetical protein [Desulfovibrio sp. OttesenSCG-928-C14]
MMMWVLAVFGVLVMACLVKVIFQTSTPKASGKNLLKQNLRKMGIPAHSMPDVFYDEVVDACILAAEAGGVNSSGEVPANTSIVGRIEAEAFNIARIVRAARTDDPRHEMLLASPLAERMRQYGLIPPRKAM